MMSERTAVRNRTSAKSTSHRQSAVDRVAFRWSAGDGRSAGNAGNEVFA